MTSRTLYEKIVQAHCVKTIDSSTVLLYVDLHFANEYTSPQAFSGLVERNLPVARPDSHLCVVDHIIPSAPVMPRVITEPASLGQASRLADNCKRFKIKAFYSQTDAHQGIEHVLIDEQALARPGMVVICGDSHTTTHGAFGALSFGIGTSEIEHILATQTLVYRLPKTMRIRIDGKIGPKATAKDLALWVLRQISARGALGHVVEYQGAAIDALSMEGRMTLCNLTVEAGARGALIAADEKTLSWIETHATDLTPETMQAIRKAAQEFRSDADAVFDKEIQLNAEGLKPQVTWGTSPDQCIDIDGEIPSPDSYSDPVAQTAAKRALAYQKLTAGTKIQGTPIQHVFIGSCTNARLADLQAASRVLQGKHIAPGVRAQVIPGSMTVRKEAEALGIDRIFKDAGFEWRMSGCSLCLAMNDDVLEAGVRCVSTTNRNFEGRQGRDSHTHLVSPETAAASAIAGCITQA